MLATEEPVTPSDDPQPEASAHVSLQEQWSGNERMRHIPSISWMIQKLDGDLRHRIEKLHAVYAALAGNDPRHAPIEQDRKSTRLNSSHLVISYAVFCLKKKNNTD